MKIRSLFLAGTALAALFAQSAAAQSAAAKAQPGAKAIPRLADGKPDFNGVWDHPRASDVTKSFNGCAAGTAGCKQEGMAELPYTEWGLAQWKDVEGRFDYSAYCLPWGYTRAWGTEYPVEIVQTPQRLALLFESNNIFHVVPTDGRSHPAKVDPNWLGNSVGHYEGDTLVIDTIGYNGKTWIDNAEHPSSDQLHLIERYTHIDADHVQFEITWDDPKTYTKPVKNTRVLSRMKKGEELMEYWCMENNKDLLEGHLIKRKDR